MKKFSNIFKTLTSTSSPMTQLYNSVSHEINEDNQQKDMQELQKLPVDVQERVLIYV